MNLNSDLDLSLVPGVRQTVVKNISIIPILMLLAQRTRELPEIILMVIRAIARGVAEMMKDRIGMVSGVVRCKIGDILVTYDRCLRLLQ